MYGSAALEPVQPVRGVCPAQSIEECCCIVAGALAKLTSWNSSRPKCAAAILAQPFAQRGLRRTTSFPSDSAPRKFFSTVCAAALLL